MMPGKDQIARWMLCFVAIAMAATLLCAQGAPGDGGEWVDLLPDAALAGWTRVPIPPTTGVDPRMQWRVDASAKTLVCSGQGGHEWLRLDKELGDFVLRVEWRFTPKGAEEKKYNSGIGVRMTRLGEIWHQAQTGLTGGYLFGQTLKDGAVTRFNLAKEMKENRIKPAGEWNQYEIRAQGDRITLVVNGEVVNELSGVGLRKGYIGLEGEGYEITFRNMRLKTSD